MAPRARASTTRLAPLGRRKKQPSHFDDPRGRVARRRLTADAGAPRQAWARELSATLRAERQRNEARALVGASSAADEFRCSAVLFNVLSDLPRADASRPFEDGRTLAHLAFERGAVFMLAAYLRAGGEWTPPTVRGPTFEKHGAKLAACRALVRGWPGNRADVARHCVVGRSHATDLAVFLRFGDVGVKSSALARKRALLAYVAWMRRRAAAGTLTLRGRDVLERAPELRGSQVHGRAARLLAGAAPERPSSPRCKTPRSRTAQIMRRSGVKLQVLPADDRPAPSPEIARWLADRGLGNILALRARPGSPAAAGKAEAPEPEAASPRADDLECAICLSLLSDPVYTPCLHVFCSRCLRAALLRATASRRKCPLCRADLPSEAPRRCGGKILHRFSCGAVSTHGQNHGKYKVNLYDTFVDVRAPLQINVSARARDEARQRLEEHERSFGDARPPPDDLFTAVLFELERLMETDSFDRFIRSSLWSPLVDAVEESKLIAEMLPFEITLHETARSRTTSPASSLSDASWLASPASPSLSRRK